MRFPASAPFPEQALAVIEPVPERLRLKQLPCSPAERRALLVADDQHILGRRLAEDLQVLVVSREALVLINACTSMGRRTARSHCCRTPPRCHLRRRCSGPRTSCRWASLYYFIRVPIHVNQIPSNLSGFLVMCRMPKNFNRLHSNTNIPILIRFLFNLIRFHTIFNSAPVPSCLFAIKGSHSMTFPTSVPVV